MNALRTVSSCDTTTRARRRLRLSFSGLPGDCRGLAARARSAGFTSPPSAIRKSESARHAANPKSGAKISQAVCKAVQSRENHVE